MLPLGLAGLNGWPLQGAVSSRVNNSASGRRAPSGSALTCSLAIGSRLSRYTYRPLLRSARISRHGLPAVTVSSVAICAARACIRRRPSGSCAESQAEIHQRCTKSFSTPRARFTRTSSSTALSPASKASRSWGTTRAARMARRLLAGSGAPPGAKSCGCAVILGLLSLPQSLQSSPDTLPASRRAWEDGKATATTHIGGRTAARRPQPRTPAADIDTHCDRPPYVAAKKTPGAIALGVFQQVKEVGRGGV